MNNHLISEEILYTPMKTITTNGFAVYASEGTTIEEICQEFETNEALWAKVTNHKLLCNTVRLSPCEWVLDLSPKSIVYTKGRDEEKIRRNAKICRTEKVTCACGRVVCRGELSKHIKTSIHRQALTS